MDNYRIAVQGSENFHAKLERQRNEVCTPAANKKLKKFRAYALGQQDVVLTREQRNVLKAILGNSFSDNVCRKILSVHTGRAELLRFGCEDKEVEDWLMNELWLKNRYNAMQSQITYATLRDGNTCVGVRVHIPINPVTGKPYNIDIKPTTSPAPAELSGSTEPTPIRPDVAVKPNNKVGRIQAVRELWWDGECGTFVKYDNYGNVEYAVKEWKERFDHGAEFTRRTVYFPHEIRRFIKEKDGWQTFSEPDDDPTTRGVIPWVKINGDPIGIPIIHFASPIREDESPYGISYLDGGVLAFQDQINAIQYDLSAAGAYAGYQMTWSTGTSLPRDDAGNAVPPQVGPGQHWHADEENAKIGVIQSGDIEAIKDSYKIKMQAVCRMTNTPLHYITGEWPSGEALIRSEIDLVESTRLVLENGGPSHTEFAHRSTEVSNAFLGTSLNEDAPIVSKLADPQRRDRLTMSQIATMEEKYTSVQERLRITGRTDAEIERIMEEMKAQAEQEAEAAKDMLEAETDASLVTEDKKTEGALQITETKNKVTEKMAKNKGTEPPAKAAASAKRTA